MFKSLAYDSQIKRLPSKLHLDHDKKVISTDSNLLTLISFSHAVDWRTHRIIHLVKIADLFAPFLYLFNSTDCSMFMGAHFCAPPVEKVPKIEVRQTSCTRKQKLLTQYSLFVQKIVNLNVSGVGCKKSLRR